MKFGVVTFPGSNCDYDSYMAVKDRLREQVQFLWHKDDDLDSIDCVILPGGFSYGDYLRSGAITRFSPVMEAVRRFAAAGGLVLGICNGFQILLESEMLPGAMLRNRSLRFVCKHVYIRCENNETPFTARLKVGEVLRIPIAHSEGNYYWFGEDLAALERSGQVLFRYCSADGEVSDEFNPNGSLGNIAGICNRTCNVFGMMPHPERASEPLLGSADGIGIFKSIQASNRVGASL
jgi:phosphoribosylformylglycinamidine synthase